MIPFLDHLQCVSFTEVQAGFFLLLMLFKSSKKLYKVGTYYLVPWACKQGIKSKAGSVKCCKKKKLLPLQMSGVTFHFVKNRFCRDVSQISKKLSKILRYDQTMFGFQVFQNVVSFFDCGSSTWNGLFKQVDEKPKFIVRFFVNRV